MELYWLWMSAATLLASYVFVFKILRRINGWYYDLKLQRRPLPPGDMGWPLLGNLLSFMRHFSYGGDPDSFINNLVSKYGRTGIYKTHVFGNPSIIVCRPDMCRQVLADDVNFKLGYPESTLKLAGSRFLNSDDSAQHKRFRRLTTAPITGHNALAVYMERVDDIMANSLEELASMQHPVEILKEMKKITFKVIVHIFLGNSNDSFVTKMGNLFSDVADGIISLPINLPGFTLHKAFEARRELARILQAVVDERRIMRKGDQLVERKDLIDILLDVEDEKLEDKDITDFLLLFLVAGHESTAVGLMWSIIYLTDHPQIMKKAKEEQEEIMKTRPPSQKHLNLKEIKQMIYLAKIVEETLRRTNISFQVMRQTNNDVNIKGYFIPKGWKVLVWTRAIHMDSEYYPNPREFDPSRWDNSNAKAAGCFLPFGGGSRLCPGHDLAKLEISIFLHHFLLGYKLERVNPKCRLTSIPTPKPFDECLARVIKI